MYTYPPQASFNVPRPSTSRHFNLLQRPTIKTRIPSFRQVGSRQTVGNQLNPQSIQSCYIVVPFPPHQYPQRPIQTINIPQQVIPHLSNNKPKTKPSHLSDANHLIYTVHLQADLKRDTTYRLHRHRILAFPILMLGCTVRLEVGCMAEVLVVVEEEGYITCRKDLGWGWRI